MKKGKKKEDALYIHEQSSYQKAKKTKKNSYKAKTAGNAQSKTKKGREDSNKTGPVDGCGTHHITLGTYSAFATGLALYQQMKTCQSYTAQVCNTNYHIYSLLNNRM